MLKKLLAVALMSLSMLSVSWAAVDVNTADHAALETLSGIGPKRSKVIVEERTKNGPYKDAADFKARVPGIGDKTLAKLESAGLTFGKAAAAPAAAKKDAKDPKKK
ncbi:ComEA family DNA-binding protein [Ralstonia soli]|uniref:Helix-hairpin-helix domain-containing protein n=1 Tax=Ralstonia soli TaxID=2953896 RepID=A0ABT1AJH7_9RALS|nr:helix-hairpin-helix domain-containing protein [Ralstonia soli]MCO5398307.1 helix-hairpin-helix domain-containing protein [Ralstonia soli]